MAAHAKLAPSASERWINCPISVHLSEGFADTQSVYAEEGTVAHKLGELKIRREFTDDPPENAEFEAVRSNPLHSAEMEDATDEYVERVRECRGKLKMADLSTEIRLDLSGVTGGDCFGTADCVICAPGEIHVFDFKYGKNVRVDAEGNPQMRLYALGAYELFDMIYGFEKVVTHIVQPRMGNYPSEELAVTEIAQWARDTVKPAARKAMAAEGDPKSGKWCQFCLAKPVCREYGKPYESVPGTDPPARLSNEEIAYRIKRLDGVDAYLKELKEYALNAILDGDDVPGFKVVEGRSVRTWTDQEKAFEAAQAAGYDRSVLYERKPLSLSKIEKMMGKKAFAQELGQFVDKPKGKPTLVPDSDKRGPYKRQKAKDEFMAAGIEFDG